MVARQQISRLSIPTCARFLRRNDAVSSCCLQRTKGRRRSTWDMTTKPAENIRPRVEARFKRRNGTQSPPDSTEMNEGQSMFVVRFSVHACWMNNFFSFFPHTRRTSEIIISHLKRRGDEADDKRNQRTLRQNKIDYARWLNVRFICVLRIWRLLKLLVMLASVLHSLTLVAGNLGKSPPIVSSPC